MTNNIQGHKDWDQGSKNPVLGAHRMKVESVTMSYTCRINQPSRSILLFILPDTVNLIGQHFTFQMGKNSCFCAS